MSSTAVHFSQNRIPHTGVRPYNSAQQQKNSTPALSSNLKTILNSTDTTGALLSEINTIPSTGSLFSTANTPEKAERDKSIALLFIAHNPNKAWTIS